MSKLSGKWQDAKISAGKFTPKQISDKEFDLLVTDATGGVFSSKQDGGVVMLAGETNKVISIIVDYPSTTVVETYKFFRDARGKAEDMWTANKGGGAPIMTAAAYKADCSIFIY